MRQNETAGPACIIGVTGGIGAGKSQVLSYLEARWQAEVIRLDDLSRKLLEVGGGCYEAVLALFGEGIRLPDGTLDRKEIAARIFAEEDLREKLDALIHPAVKEEAKRRIASSEAPLFVIEAALLIEDHYDAICDEMWYIYADANTRYARLVSSRGYDGERIRNTMKRQLSDEAFRAHADFVIDNSGEFEWTKAQIDARIREIVA